jgi:hypothetical protein
LIQYYKDKECIPKELAFAFLDISSYFERAYNFYSESEQEKIFDLKEEIVDLGEKLFS